METYKKVGDDLEVTRVRVVSKERLEKRLARAEKQKQDAQTIIDNTKAKLAEINK